MKQICRVAFLIMFFLCPCVTAEASSLEDYDFSKMNDWDEEQIFDIDFYTLTNDIVKNSWNLNGLFQKLYEAFLKEVREGFQTSLFLLNMILVAAIFKSMTTVLGDHSVSKIGILLTYAALIVVLYHNFELCIEIVQNSTNQIMDFLYALLPTFFCAVTFCSGALSGSLLYQWTVLCLSLVNLVLIKFIMPMVKYYIIISLINNSMEESRFSNLCSLIRKIIVFINKGMIGIILGLSAVKTMTIPLADSIKNAFLRKAISCIPGIGNSVDCIAQTISGTGNLIKNSIGTAGLIVVALIMLLPLCKLIAMNFMIHLLAAISEPVSDVRILKGIKTVTDGIGLLQYLLCTSGMIFLVMIGMICASTGVK